MKRSEARSEAQCPREETYGQIEAWLGPFPASTVRALADLGLSDIEVARYYRTQPVQIAKIRLFATPEPKIAWYPSDLTHAGGQARTVPDRWPSGRRP